MQSRSTGTRGTGTTSGQTPSNHRHLDINIQSVAGRRDTSAATAIQQGKMETSALKRSLIPPHPRVTRHRTRDNQPSFTIRTDDRFVITRESDILYTLGVIEKRLLSMHCGLPWCRELGGEGVISCPYTIRYDPRTILQYSVPTHARVSHENRSRAPVLPVYETQYTWPLSILRAVCRQQLTRGAQSADCERGTRTHTRWRTGWRNLAPILMIIGAPRFAGSGQITPSKKGEILVPLFGSNVARWMCIWINFLFDNGLMKRLNRRSAGLSRLVSLNEKGKG